MRISVVAPTGDRPEALRLWETYISRQTRKPDEVILIDDGWAPVQAELSIATEVIRPRQLWNRGDNTQGRNLLIGLAAATGDIIAFMEDDDWYHPQYLEHMAALIENGADIAGELRSIYYHIPSRLWLQNENTDHASLCQTVINRRMAPYFADILNYNYPFFDLALWQMAGVARNGWKPVLEDYQGLCVGIKGLPGRVGIGCGHRPNKEFWHEDSLDLDKLYSLIGDDVKLYEPFVGRQTATDLAANP